MRIIDLQNVSNLSQEDFIVVHNTNNVVAQKAKVTDLVLGSVSTSTNNIVYLQPDQFSVNLPNGQVTLVLPHTNQGGSAVEINIPSSPSVGDMYIFIKSVNGIQSGVDWILNFPNKEDVLNSNLIEGIKYGLSKSTIIDYLIYTNEGWFLSAFKEIDTRFPFTDQHVARFDVDNNAPLNVVNNAIDPNDDYKLDYWNTDVDNIMSPDNADCQYSSYNWDDSSSDLAAGDSLLTYPSADREWRVRKHPNSTSSNSYTTLIFGNYNPGDPTYPDAQVVRGTTFIGWFNFGNIPFYMKDNNSNSLLFLDCNIQNTPDTQDAEGHNDVIDQNYYAGPGQTGLRLAYIQDNNSTNGPNNIILQRYHSGYYKQSYPVSLEYASNVPQSIYDGLTVENDTWYLCMLSDIIFAYEEGTKNTNKSKKWTHKSSIGMASNNKVYFLTGYEWDKVGPNSDTTEFDTLVTQLGIQFRVGHIGGSYYVREDNQFNWDDIRVIDYPVSEKSQWESICKEYGLL